MMAKRKTTTPAEQWPAGFTAADKALFKKFRVPAKKVVAWRISRVNDSEARRDGIGKRIKGDMSGLKFPHTDWLTGKETTVTVRRDNPGCDKKGKPLQKYMTPRGSTGLYFPPDARAKLEARSDILFVLVESQKATLVMSAFFDRRGQGDQVLVVGLRGCFGWSSNKEPLPDLNLFEGKTVYVALDSNVEDPDKPLVRVARDRLTTALNSMGCDVHTLRIPSEIDGVEINGPDDLLALEDGDRLMDEVLAGNRKAEVAPGSDDALGTQLAEEQKDELRHVAAWKRWLVWDGQRWKEDTTQEVRRRAQDFCLEQAKLYGKLAEARRIRSSKTIDAVMREASGKAGLAATAEQWDKDPWLLGTPGGVVDLRTGELREAKREDYITKLTDCAPDRNCPTPRWTKFLDEITDSDNELQAYLQRKAGYLLTGDTSEHALFFLYGTGANGKSVFVSTLLRMLGDYARVASMEMFMATHSPQHPTDLAGLRGARLVTATETEDGSRWAESKLKSITGGERITARRMREDFSDYTPQFKLLLSGNHRPRLRSVDDAMRRRMHLVPFVVTIPEKDRDSHLAEKLRDEWGGVLQWAIEGCLLWQKQGLRPPRAVTDATTEYLDEQDVIGLWLQEATVPEPNAKTPPSLLHAAYLGWAEKNNEYQLSANQFAEKLSNRGYPTTRSNGVRRVALRLKTEVEKTKAEKEAEDKAEDKAKTKGVGRSKKYAPPTRVRVDVTESVQ
jgi:putative DNA primase/helicase